MTKPRLRLIGRLALAGLGLAVLVTSQALACGRDSDCPLGERSYRVVLPEGQANTSPAGAIIYAHGYRGSAAGVMRSKALTGLADQLGVAFVAAQAAGPDWKLPGVPNSHKLPDVDDLAYFDALAADLTRRFGVDRDRIMATGFSAGGMMVWHLACYRGDAFIGLAPLSGTFWEPIPEACPVRAFNLIHYHGREDPVVPMQGRPIQDAHQGDIFEAMALAERTGSFSPVASEPVPGLDCTRQVNGRGNLLELCLFDGRHEMKARHIARAWQIFRGLAAE